MHYLEAIDYQQPEFGDQYDELPLWSAPFGLKLLEQTPLRSGMTILDVGAGTGFLTIELAQRCGPTATVIAVDPWTAAMDRLQRKLDYLGIRNVRTLIADAAALDLPDGSVDLIVSNLGINNFENADAVLRECHRVAKPGANLLLTTNLVGHMAEFYDAYREVLVKLGLSDQLTTLDQHIHHRATVESLGLLLGGAGFETREVTTWSFRERFVDGAALLRHFRIRLGFLPAWKSIVPPEWTERAFAALERRLNDIAFIQGELALTIPAACVVATRRDV